MQIEKAKQHYLHTNGFEETHLKALLFDMDGVLFDSMPIHASSWSAVMTQFGLEMTPEEAYMHEGRTGADTINILTQRHWGRPATAEEIEQIYATKCQTFNENKEAPRMDGAANVLAAVKRNGLYTGVVTGSGQHSLIDRLERNFPGYFKREQMVTSSDVTHGKPDPEPYLKGLAKARVNPWEAIVVENAPLGVQAATKAGIFTIAVNTGPLPDHVLLDAGANLLFPSMQALADAWDEIYSRLK